MRYVCTVCGDESALESHHVAGRKNSNTALVCLCPRCHRDQTDRQWRSGVLSRREREPSNGLLLHAIIEGISGILIAQAHRIGTEDLVQTDQRFRHTTLRLLDLLSDDAPGPRPIANDRNRNRRSAAQPVPPKLRTVSPAESVELLAGIFPALASAITELLGEDDEHARVAQQIATGTEQLASALAALEDHPRSDEFAAIMKRGFEDALTMFEQLAAATAADAIGEEPEIDTDALAETLRSLRDLTSFMTALATGDDPFATLDALLTDINRVRRA